MSSRLVRAASGKPVGVEVTVPSVGLDHGVRFMVLGDESRRPGNKFAFHRLERRPAADTPAGSGGATSRRVRARLRSR